MKTALSFTAHTAAARKKRLEQLESALALVRDAVVTADIYARITYMNPAAERLTHRQSGDAVGQPISEVLSFVDTESGGSIREAIDTLTLEKVDASGLFRRAVLLNGTDSAVIPVIIEYCVSEFRDAQGMLCGTMMIFRDIMRRRTSELALQQSENTLLENAAALFEERERAQVTLNSIGDAVISTDFRGRVTYLNKIAEEITGWI